MLVGLLCGGPARGAHHPVHRCQARRFLLYVTASLVAHPGVDMARAEDWKKSSDQAADDEYLRLTVGLVLR